MDWAGTITAAATIVTALGGLELIKFLLNRKSNRKITEANAFEVERKAIIEDYKRVQEEVDSLKMKVDELYKKVHQLERERLDLIHENNKLRLALKEAEIALKEAEKHMCLQPDDRCLQRLNPDDKCRLRKLLREGYLEDNPGAIVTEDDMGTAPTSDRDRLCVVPEERADDYFVKID